MKSWDGVHPRKNASPQIIDISILKSCETVSEIEVGDLHRFYGTGGGFSAPTVRERKHPKLGKNP
jgi:hypothetical protein